MKVSSLLPIFQTLLETAVIARAQYLMSKAHKDRQGMIDSLETSLAVDQDIIALLTGDIFQALELSAKDRLPKIEGTPEEIIELLTTIKREQSASITNLINQPLHDIPEIEERRIAIRDRKMQVVGDFFRKARRILKERWGAWTAAYERQFKSMLKLRAPRKKR